jgi:hypothetical protein
VASAAAPCRVHAFEMTDLLARMASVLAELADETSEIQWHMAPLLENATSIDPAAVGDLQRLDRHAQYLVELSRMTEGLARISAARSISVPALCRLVHLPSLRHRFLRDAGEPPPEEQEAGSVSMF